MKTSNKLIWFGLIAIALCFSAFLIAAKSAMVESKFKYVVGTGEMITKNLGPLNSSTLKLGSWCIYKLDPNSSDIIIEGYSNTNELIKNMQSKGVLDTWKMYGKEVNVEYENKKPTLTLGILNKTNLTIMSETNAEVKALDSISVDKIKLYASNNSEIDLHIDCKSLVLRANNNSRIKLSGSADIVSLNTQNNATLDALDFYGQNWIVDMANASKAAVNVRNSIDGSVSQSSSLKYKGDVANTGLIRNNSAQIEQIID